MVRNFKGVVKVADVQEEFDNLLNTINAKIDEYNGSLNIEDVDYNNGGTDLAPYGYTLSVGGLKKVLDAYDGAILGANVLRRADGQYIISEGIYIKDRQVLRLPSKVLNGSGDKVYFNSTNNTYAFTEGGEPIEVPYVLPAISGSDTSTIGVLSNFRTKNNIGSILSPEGSVHTYNSFKNNTADNVVYNISTTYGYSQGIQFDLTFLNTIYRLTSVKVTVKVKSNISLNGCYLHIDIGKLGLNRSTGAAKQISNDNLEQTFTATIPEGSLSYLGDNWQNIVLGCSISATDSSSAPLPAGLIAPELSIGDIEIQGIVRTEPGGDILITKINPNRLTRLCNRPNATNEEIPDYKVTIESKNSGYVINGNQYLSNSDKGQFYSGSAGRNCRINLFDTQVAYHQWHGDRTDSYHEPLNFMFIPKGISNPYNGLAGEVRFAMQKVWNYILQRPSR